MTKLPAEGRKGRAPAWPLPDDITIKAHLAAAKAQVKLLLTQISECTDGRTRGKLNRELGEQQKTVLVLTEKLKAMRALERSVWNELWKTPQAVQWDRLSWTRDVAIYVRHKVRGELGSIEDAREARMWSDRLGLNPTAMLKLRWTVVVDEVTAKREERQGSRSRARSRVLKALPPPAASGE